MKFEQFKKKFFLRKSEPRDLHCISYMIVPKKIKEQIRMISSNQPLPPALFNNRINNGTRGG